MTTEKMHFKLAAFIERERDECGGRLIHADENIAYLGYPGTDDVAICSLCGTEVSCVVTTWDELGRVEKHWNLMQEEAAAE